MAETTTNKVVRKMLHEKATIWYEQHGTSGYKKIYRLLSKASGTDYEELAKRNNMSTIDFIESQGKLEELVRIAEKAFGCKILNSKGVKQVRVKEKAKNWIMKVNYLWGEGEDKRWEVYGTIGRRCYLAESAEEAIEDYIESAMGEMKNVDEEEMKMRWREAKFDVAVAEREKKEVKPTFSPKGYSFAEYKIDMEARSDYVYGNKMLSEVVDWLFAEKAKLEVTA